MGMGMDWTTDNTNEEPETSDKKDETDIPITDSVDELVDYEESLTSISVDTDGDKKTWAVRVNLEENVYDFHQRIPHMAHTWPFELDSFQKQAILRLESQECVFVAAHTSAGKTVVAEYAIALSLSHMTKTIYTSPIKALSNQKFRDFRQTFGEENIGLVTGDVQIRKEAPCLIMTTEILRSMLYHGSDIIRDVEWVVFDEVHYINDSERGVVWEEVMIMLPDHIRLILLSATVPNAMEFADWVGRTKRKNIYVLSTTKRPVPLQHFLYTGNSKQTQDQLFMIVDEKRKFLTEGYKLAMESKKERQAKDGSTKFGPKVKFQAGSKQDKNIWISLVYMLQKKDKLPLVAFTLSRKRCDDNAYSLSSLDLIDAKDKHKIDAFFQKSISILKGTDRQLPQVMWMRDLLKRGIAVHHSGILPIVKEVIEMLFAQGLVKLLFATETFAMGVNMPARTVAFDSTRKHDGVQLRDLYPGEYVQMAGRAGRRGKDTTGTVIILCKDDVPESGDLHKMILGIPTTLESQFRLTYSMLLNIMRVETLRVEDVMKRSFGELDSMKHEVDRKQKLESLQQSASSLETLTCPECYHDIDQYYQSCVQLNILKKKIQTLLFSSGHTHKALSPGRVIIIFTNKYLYSLAIILQENVKRNKELTYKILMLCNPGDDTESSLVDSDSSHVTPYQPMKEFFKPDGETRHVVLDISGDVIVGVVKNETQVDAKRIIRDYEQRQIPRFKDSPPVPETMKAVAILQQISETQPKGLAILDPVKDLKMSGLGYIELRDEKEMVEDTMLCYSCIKCPKFNEHFEHARKKAEVLNQLSQLRYMLSEESLQMLPEYQHKVEVLKHFKYISNDGVVQLKGRVSCTIHTHEIVVTELLFRNILQGFEPAEIAALLSCMVFQQSKCSDPNYTDRLSEGKKKILEVVADIANVERSFGLDTSVEEYQNEFKFGLIEVVYEWAKGEEFLKIIELTDVLEGVIVKCIQRLDELCRDIGKAARVVGDPQLGQTMLEVSNLIRRDIVFAASLYTM